ncbi:MAG: glycosyltransferase [Candidatus Dormibacteria bacterium]
MSATLSRDPARPTEPDVISRGPMSSPPSRGRRLALGQPLGNRPFPRTSVPDSETALRRRFTQTVAVVALLVTLAYLGWRLLYTLNLAEWWISVPLLVLELQAAVGLGVFAVNLWNVDAVPLAVPRDGTDLQIALLIPTYNEPQETLLPTVAAAVSASVAHETWVLDDGDRQEVRELAERLGARYLARPTHEHAKAGNVNYALERIDAELVAIIDADQVVRADLFRNTLGYFDDNRIALVQTHQDFYNLQSFEHERGLSEQGLFYRARSAGRNRWNAAFSCGTGAIFRMAALRDVGGLATETVTEGIHTSLRLHRRGWKTVFHNEVLAHGLAAGNVVQYLSQRLRWGIGAMQLLRRENPATVSGLTLMQRMSYLTTLLGWFDAWRSLGYLLAPMVVLWAAGVPIRSPFTVFAPIFIVTFLAQRYAMHRLARSTSGQGLTTISAIVRMPANLQATLRLLARSEQPFRVTDKGRLGDTGSRIAVPWLLWALMGASLLTLGWAVASLLGITPVHYGVAWVAYGSMFWLVLNTGLLLAAIWRIRSQRFASERRASVRFDVDAPAQLGDVPARLLDASWTGARILVPLPSCPPSAGSNQTLAIQFQHRIYTFDAVVRGVTPGPDPGPAVVVGLEFLPGQTGARAALAQALFQTGAEPRGVLEPEKLPVVRGAAVTA